MEVYRAQRERLRRMQRRYAELQQAMGRPIEPSADFDFISPVRPTPESMTPTQQQRYLRPDAPSPPRLSLHNGLVLGLGRDRANEPSTSQPSDPKTSPPQPKPHHVPSAETSASIANPSTPPPQPMTRRPVVEPSDVLQEFDENFWGSFHENESPIRPPRRPTVASSAASCFGGRTETCTCSCIHTNSFSREDLALTVCVR
ncbi:hypothetical protein PINS_up001558 [Pythium insidiosum]|nr:hypothetical protein PINS_up001558 [Pythium insidiosum]